MTATAEQQTEAGGARLPADRVKAFVLAGNATFTLRNAKTDTHLTYKIQRGKDRGGQPPPHYVKARVGTEYVFLGAIFTDGNYRHGKRSEIAEDASSARAFVWFWSFLQRNRPLPADLQVWHEGACAACGRPLTDPASLSRGFGDVCYRQLYAAPSTSRTRV